jgi:three-Cys-motif partner protein
MKDTTYYKGREQTYLKHFVLENYLEKLSWIIGLTYRRLCYVDSFSGPWKSASDDYGDTSIKISLDILEKTRKGLLERGESADLKCIFIEKDEAIFDELEAVLASNPAVGVQTIPLKGEFEELIEKVLSEARGFFTLFFIDPSGWTGYGLERITQIVTSASST